MKKVWYFILVLIILDVIINGIRFIQGEKIHKEETMKLTSPVFSDNQPIPVDYSCRGKGLRPPLIISGVPAGIKALVLTMDDPDAPNGTFHHWLVWNIPVATSEIGKTLPAGSIEGTNSAGSVGYFLPCPPSGTHRYVFTLYATDQILNLPASTNSKKLESALAGHSISKTTLTGIFSK